MPSLRATAKQSRLSADTQPKSGLLRYARNDGQGACFLTGPNCAVHACNPTDTIALEPKTL